MGAMVFICVFVFFVHVTLFFSSFLLVLSGTFPQKTKHPGPCLKILGSAQHLALKNTQMTRSDAKHLESSIEQKKPSAKLT